MLRTKIVTTILVFGLVLTSFAAQSTNQQQKLTGPITYKNLSIFLIQGEDNSVVSNIITLQEAIEQKKIIIHETENVNELHVENTSNIHIFIQSGDIVKGGKQDRVIQFDFVVNPNSGRIPISSFCVEQQRWSKRGKEDLKQFNSSNNRITSKRLKLAAKENQSQQEVWEAVSVAQDKLSGSVGKSVRSSISNSSLQLTLEDKDIIKQTNDYIKNINKKITNTNNIIGYVFAINGEINSADIYANTKLFNKMWPKLLKASSIEAVSEFSNSNTFNDISKEQVIKWLDEVENGTISNKTLDNNVMIKTKNSEKNVLFETYMDKNETYWIHKNMIKK